jgi:hypothetical protein
MTVAGRVRCMGLTSPSQDLSWLGPRPRRSRSRRLGNRARDSEELGVRADAPKASPQPPKVSPRASGNLSGAAVIPGSPSAPRGLEERVEGVSLSLPFSDLLALTSSHMFLPVMDQLLRCS